MADPDKDNEIGASIPGTITKILVDEGQEIKKGDSIVIIEAMKMETNILSKTSGTVEKILVSESQQVKTGQLLIKLK